MLKREIRKMGTLILEHMTDDQYKTKWLMALTEQDGDTYERIWGELTTIHQEQRKMTNYWIFKQRNITLERKYHLFKPIFSLLFCLPISFTSVHILMKDEYNSFSSGISGAVYGHRRTFPSKNNPTNLIPFYCWPTLKMSVSFFPITWSCFVFCCKL